MRYFCICATVIRSCGDSTSTNNTYFVNANYPSSFDGTGSCQLQITKANSNICQLRSVTPQGQLQQLPAQVSGNSNICQLISVANSNICQLRSVTPPTSASSGQWPTPTFASSGQWPTPTSASSGQWPLLVFCA